MKPHVCVICGNYARMGCAQCLAPYCNAQCQRIDWQAGHALQCVGKKTKSGKRDYTFKQREIMSFLGDVRLQDYEEVEKMLNRGVDPRINDNEAIKLAATNDDADMVRLLLEYGAPWEQLAPILSSLSIGVRQELQLATNRWDNFIKYINRQHSSIVIGQSGDAEVNQMLADTLFLKKQFQYRVMELPCKNTQLSPDYLENDTRRILSGHRSALVLFDKTNQSAKAFMSFEIATDEFKRTYATIYTQCSAEQYRGWGRRLFNEFGAMIEGRRVKYVKLHAVDDAIGFWSRMGFRHVNGCDGSRETNYLTWWRREMEKPEEKRVNLDTQGYFCVLETNGMGNASSGFTMYYCPP